MKKLYIILFAALLFSQASIAQLLNVSIVNTGGNHIVITGTPSSLPGFTTHPSNKWASLNLGLRFLKSAVLPPTPANHCITSPFPAFVPCASSSVTAEGTTFNILALSDAQNGTGTLDLSLFDATDFGLADDGYWYISVTSNGAGLQNIPFGSTVTILEFILPPEWKNLSPGVEILLADIPGFGVSTESSIVCQNLALGNLGNVINVVTNNAPLPVSLLYFNAQPAGSDVKLKWTTTSEHNSKQFIVERSFDGSRFIPIGAPVKAAGNSNVNLDYSLTDAGVLASATSPYVFYRLKVIDLDNHSGNSNVAKVAINNREKYGAILYPNITSSNATLQLTFEKADDQVQVRVVDMLGKVLQSTKVAVGIGSTVHNIDVSSYPAGMYSVQVQSTNLTKTLKLVKSN